MNLKFLPAMLLILSLCGCSGSLMRSSLATCPGSVEVPAEFTTLFTPVDDEALLNAALGAPGTGSLCQGKVYTVNNGAEVTLYRAWNSTNQGSRLGHWWAFSRPEGKVAGYRSDYEICYQWSPLDKLTECTIRPGTKVVVGTGQGVTCSEYLSYPASAVKQIYLGQSATAVAACRDYDLLFSWQPAGE